MYCISKAYQYVGLQSGRALEHCVLLSVGCLGREIIASFLSLSVFNKFPSLLVFDLMYVNCHPVSCFTYVNKRRCEKAIGSVVGFYCIQRIG